MGSRVLNLWMNGELVGRWWSSRGGESRLEYADEWMGSPRGRPISLSLPFTPGSSGPRGKVVEQWFDNLLPDSDAIRSRLGARYHVDGRDAHALLGAIGRDCVGALQLAPDGVDPGRVDNITARTLTPEMVAERLLAVPNARPFGGADYEDDDLRISIAGAQEKTALLWHNGTWCIPQGNTPTTHILKLPIGEVAALKADFSTSVQNEWLCLTLLSAMGLPAATSEIGRFSGQQGDVTALIVTRFDRQKTITNDREWIARIPQEDCCQATGTPASLKYERDGGPGIARILGILSGSETAELDASVFVRTQLVFWLLAAPDGHAKNFSLFIRAQGRYRLTPIYDVLSAWPIVGSGPKEWHVGKVGLAMGVRGKSGLNRYLPKIHLEHWKRLSSSTGITNLFETMIAMVETVPSVLASVESQLPTDFPTILWERMSDGMLRQRERFLGALHAGKSE